MLTSVGEQVWGEDYWWLWRTIEHRGLLARSWENKTFFSHSSVDCFLNSLRKQSTELWERPYSTVLVAFTGTPSVLWELPGAGNVPIQQYAALRKVSCRNGDWMSSAANVRYLVGIVSLSAFYRGTARTFLTKFAHASIGTSQTYGTVARYRRIPRSLHT